MNEALVVNLAPTGVLPTKESNKHVPVGIEEIVEDVVHCAELGVAMVHLHARDANGQPSSEPMLYGEIIDGVREHHPDLVVVVTTSGRHCSAIEKRSAVLELSGRQKPDMASLTLSSMNFLRQESVNSPATVRLLAEKMAAYGIKPELEVFDTGMINYAKYLADKGIIDAPFYFNLLLGNIATAQASFLHLGTLTTDLPHDSLWSLGGIGQCQLAMNTVGIAMAPGIRVGLEDNLWLDVARHQPACNLTLVRRVVELARLLNRRLATPAEVRARLGLPAKQWS